MSSRASASVVLGAMAFLACGQPVSQVYPDAASVAASDAAIARDAATAIPDASVAADGGAPASTDAAIVPDGSVIHYDAAGPAESDAALPGDASLLVDAGQTTQDTGVQLVPDAGNLTVGCAAAGGVQCTVMSWEQCPRGTEPVVTGGGKEDCQNSGWCCQTAPASPCSQSGSYAMCMVGTCSGCWMDYTNTDGGVLSCETGRSCCIDICD